ncbi:MAG: esterase/lipase family protein [Rubripirellula sp.]
MHLRTQTPIQFLWIATLAIVVSAGCRTPKLLSIAGLATPSKATPTATHAPNKALLKQLSEVQVDETLQQAVANFQAAETARLAADPQCVSQYANAALACWPHLRPMNESTSPEARNRVAWEVYHESVERLLDVAWEHGQFDPQRGISFTQLDGKPAFIRVSRHGFPWQSEDFNEVRVLHQKVDSKLARYWSDPGLGVPMVIVRRREQKQDFLGKAIPYSATGILRPSSSTTTAQSVSYLADVAETGGDGAIPNNAGLNNTRLKSVAFTGSATKSITDDSAFRTASHHPPDGPNEGGVTASLSDVDGDTPPTIAVLELHDPAYITDVSIGNQDWQINRDTSAPLGMALNEFHHHKYKSFLMPGKANEDAGLRMFEPYKEGKIPIVLVHGLLSDRATWVDLANDLRSSPWFNRHYQVWFFQYETGQPYITSALEMRNALREAVAHFDPKGTDPAMQQMVLVGHSMGGLVSKLQISTSGSDLWDSIAIVPADEIRTTEEKHQQIRQLFFFEPLPFVKRAVFIGSPHQGSNLATSWIGRLGSALVHPSRERAESNRTILADNPGVFVKDVTRHTPTSVDLLRPDNPLLMATYTLPVNPTVQLHTIIGTGRSLRDGTPADGVVPVESARHPGTMSEKLIDTTHTHLPDHPETTNELVRILGDHVQEFEQPSVVTAKPR